MDFSDNDQLWNPPARVYAPGIGDAVADRTINRKKADGSVEKWEDVAWRVAAGNASLHAPDSAAQFANLHHHLRQASVLMSGRHLQHTDENIGERNMEVLTNCSSAASSFILFYLLLNGSGVGRAYDNDLMVVDWAKHMPQVITYIRPDHPDVLSGEISKLETDDTWAYLNNVIVYRVPDSREGWAKAVEHVEYLTWRGDHADRMLVLDFSDVRERGAPIAGMQNRPASGPGPLMNALASIAKVRGNGMDPWKATMHVDHALAECVLVGGARRAARMATKTWRDENVGEFVSVKRGGVLWSSNNSVTVDEEFWKLVKATDRDMAWESDATFALRDHAQSLFEAICQASYHDGTGEPGLINVERLTQKNEGLEQLFDGQYAESQRFQLEPRTLDMTAQIAQIVAAKPFSMIVNPCGEIPLLILGAYCTIADVVPFHAQSDDDAEDAFRAATRALIRVNTMDCLYGKEVKRTNRVGVGFTGLHEYAWARFGFGWKDLVDEAKSIEFWCTMARFSRACVDEAVSYSAELGVAVPHTVTTVKPAGTTSKLFGLTEGAHLPSMREYLRWVQFRNGDPLIADYVAKGYPVRELVSYSGTTIVGFPTVPEIVKLGMGEALVTAAEATPEEQYEYLRLLEKWWLGGFDEATGEGHSHGGQVSYTLKYKPTVTSYEQFRQTLLDGQSTIKCCSVMPQTDASAYEYQPEEPVTSERFAELLAGIKDDSLVQDIDFAHLDCGGGACPIDFNDAKVA
jgi:adenosylcobalamin-dependent ribonucleoside-triphosphate reductase